MYLFVSLDPTLVTGLALRWSWEIDNAAETRNKNGARGRDTRIPYYANPRVILKTNRCLLSPYISVLYVSVSPENETFNVSTPMMDLILNNSQRMEGLWLYQERKEKPKDFWINIDKLLRRQIVKNIGNKTVRGKLSWKRLLIVEQ